MDAASGIYSSGTSMMAGSDAARRPNENETGITRFQGQPVAEITRFLILGREHSSGRR